MHDPLNCVFCQIIAGTLPTKGTLLDTADFLVFPDLNPKAPTHLLVIPKKPYTTLEDALAEDPDFGAALLNTTSQAAHLAKISDNYQLKMNVGAKVQQVHHVHLHLLGGWAPKDRPI